MKNTVIRTISALAFGFAATIAASASATSGTVTGKVSVIQIQSTASGNNYFTLNATTSVGKCIKSSNNQVMALIPDDDRGKAMISVVDAALLAGKTVQVWVDDKGSASSTYCFASWIQMIP